MDILALDMGKVLGQWVWPIAQFLIGLGLVVFVHEFGHFLAAKAVGIKVLCFAMGMGPRLVGIRRGGTDYCVNLLPLGGYLRMLGQEDFKPVEGDPQAPGSFESKSVGARLVVIAAGVVMNIILAALLFVIVGMIGKPFPAPVVGDVAPGSPAALATITWVAEGATQPATQPDIERQTVGIRPGDRITRIDGDSLLLRLIDKDVTHAGKLLMVGVLSDPNATYTMTIRRQVDGRTLVGKARIGMRSITGQALRDFGIGRAFNLVVGELEGYRSDEPWQAEDRVLAVAGEAVQHPWQVAQIARRLDGQPIAVTVQRGKQTIDVQVQPELRFTSDRGLLYLKDGTKLTGHLLDVLDGNIVVFHLDGNQTMVLEDRVVGGSPKDPLDILGMNPRLVVRGV
ncbi:MAG TPA: site-2 protease family protein, partial [Phycisphaerae bacterium]|nr:site-2 protease family protein [Phycisphaerae bacterium]